MKTKIISYFVVLTFMLSGCYDNKENPVFFSHNDFHNTKELKGECIEVPTELSPDEMYVVRDSLVLICNTNPSIKKKIGLYNLKDWKLLGEYAERGHSNDEFIDCSVILKGNSNEFFLKDIQKSQFWICDFDSLAKNRPCAKRRFSYSRNVIDVYPLDSTYIGYNFWYLNDEKYDNNVSAIAEYPMREDIREVSKNKYKYFVANVTGGVVFRNPENHDIWVAYRHDNIIEIYDSLLNLQKTMKGPNYRKNKYVTQEMSNQEIVSFTDKSYTSCYTGGYVTNNHVYIIYENHTCDKFPQRPLPVEILMFDWDGNCLCNYRLDRFAYAISIDSKEKIMYATCCDENSGEIQLIKYSL